MQGATITKLKRTTRLALTKSQTIQPTIPTKESLAAARLLYFKTDPTDPENRQNILKTKMIIQEPIVLPKIRSENKSPNIGITSKDLYNSSNSMSPKKRVTLARPRPLLKDLESPSSANFPPSHFDRRHEEIRDLMQELKRDEMRENEELNKERVKIKATMIKKPKIKTQQTEIFDFEEPSMSVSKSNVLRLDSLASQTNRLKKQVSFEEI